MSKLTSNGNVKVAWILEADLANPAAPTPAELNDDAIDISAAIAFDGYELGASDSDDLDDRALTDLGNAVTRGFASYSATLPFFYDANYGDTNSVYNDAFDAFRVPLTTGYLVSRVGQNAADPFAAGDVVSVFKFISGAGVNDTEGDSYKFSIDFLPQGALWVNTLVATAAPVIALPATITSAVGDVDAISATVDGTNITHTAVYSSSAPAVASVSQLGVVTSLSAGSATITVNHPAANASDSVTVTVS